MVDNSGPSHLKSLLEFTLMLSIRAFINVKCKLRLNVLINYTIIYTVYSQYLACDLRRISVRQGPSNVIELVSPETMSRVARLYSQALETARDKSTQCSHVEKERPRFVDP